MAEYVYTALPDRKAAIEDLKGKIERRDYNLGVFFLTSGLMKHHRDFSKLLNCDTVCVPVEGFATRKGVWTRGGLLWLIDEEVEVEKYSGGAEKVLRAIRDSKSRKFSLIVFPALYIGSRIETLTAMIRDRRSYSSYVRGNKLALRSMSRYLLEKHVYPINDVLRVFRDRGEVAVALNLFPLEVAFNSPKIALNGREIGRGLLRIGFRRFKSVKYEDTFPERGRSLDENIEILRSEVGLLKEVEVEFEGVAIGSISGKPARYWLGYRQNFLRLAESGEFLGASPQALWMFSRETNGCCGLGLMDTNTNFYPSLYNLDSFYNRMFLAYSETTKYLLSTLCDFLLNSESEVFFIDVNFLLIYESAVASIADCLEDSFAVFDCVSLTFSTTRRYFTEIERGIFSNLTRNAAALKL
ncbi:MAG: hypothetical protein ABWW66_02505 [Archaeoglobaceae archaeon]